MERNFLPLGRLKFIAVETMKSIYFACLHLTSGFRGMNSARKTDRSLQYFTFMILLLFPDTVRSARRQCDEETYFFDPA